uniref:RNA-directed DNA polymerase n=1 Tax=Fagus sylvatica TaxID=28930 RepID=A0A2N9FQR3_FAGSY
MLPEFRAHLENLDISRFGQLLQKARKTALSVKPHVEKPKEKKTQPQVLTVSTVNNKRKKPNEKSFEEPPPPVPCTLEEIMAILDKWVADGIIKLPEVSKKATEEDKKNPKFCYFHQYVHHSTADCWTLRRKFHEKIQDGTLELPQARQKVYIDPFLNHKEKGTVSVVIHGNASDVDMDEPVAANSAMTPTAIKALQRNPRFRSLFNQLGLNPEARTAATEAIMAIAADSGAHCFTAETHASRAFLETTNAITFTDEDMEVQYPDHRRPLYLSATINEVQVRRALVDTGSCINLIPLSTIQAAEISQRKIQGAPMEIKGFGGVGEYTKGHIQLVLKVGPIVSLTRFHVVDSVVPYHILLGRPWLHKHQLIPSTYHQCVKGRLNGKPIRIAANSTPFDQSESHFVEAALYDEITPAGEASLAKPIGIPLPKWEEIKDAPEADLRDLLERKKKRKAEASASKSQPQFNATDIPESAEAVEVVAADPKISAKEELETSGTIYEDLPSGGRSSNYPRSQEATFSWFYQANTASTVAVQYSPREEKEWSDSGVVWTFRNLNKACPKDEFPLPNMDLLIDSAAGHAMFSFMDGFSGYNQIFMSPKDAEKTAFRTPIGNFYYTVMPFGLKNAGATKIICHSHYEATNYTQGAEELLGQAIIHKKIYSWPCCCDFYFRTTLEERERHSIGLPNAKKPLKSQAIGALIAQENDNGVEQPIYYVSRTLKDAESRYSGAERSCLALIYASQRLRHYFLAHKVQLMTKSHPIRSLLQRPVLSGRLAQWLLQLSQYEITAETPTAIKSQAIADLLAQFPREDNSFITDEVPGEINEIFMAGLADSVWTLKFDGSSTATSAGAGIVLYKEGAEAVTKSFKFDFPCSNNAAEYEAYLAGLAIAYEMGIKHLRVIGDSNLVDALATLGSQITFEGEEMDVTICKRADLREIKDYTLISGDLYRRLPGGVLARCISLEEAKERLPEVHEKTCGDGGAISLYRRLQRLGYFWPNMSAEAAEIQSQCPTCQFHYNNEEVCATFVSTDWRTPFLEYLLERILPSNPKDAYRLKRLALRYFVEGGTLFRKGFHGEPLRCLSLSESQMVMKETHAGECGEHQGKKRLYQCLLTLGYYWPTMKKDAADFVKTCHTCQVQANLIHTHPTSLQNMATPWPFHTWGLDLIGPINPASGGYIWILVATEYFTKWVEAIPLRKGNRTLPGQASTLPHLIILKMSSRAYRSSPKTATGFTPFSLVYGTDTISPTELVVPSPREGLDEARDLAKAKSQRNYQKMANVYSKALRVRIFAEGQMVLKAAEFVRRNLPSPSKFSPNWDGPYIIREAHGSGYYRLSKSDGTALADPINGKWLKHYYS